jgi:hypothetical protein
MMSSMTSSMYEIHDNFFYNGKQHLVIAYLFNIKTVSDILAQTVNVTKLSMTIILWKLDWNISQGVLIDSKLSILWLKC